jgi:hypothetical protein
MPPGLSALYFRSLRNGHMSIEFSIEFTCPLYLQFRNIGFESALTAFHARFSIPLQL